MGLHGDPTLSPQPRQIVPPAFRSDANVIELRKFTLQEQGLTPLGDLAGLGVPGYLIHL